MLELALAKTSCDNEATMTHPLSERFEAAAQLALSGDKATECVRRLNLLQETVEAYEGERIAYHYPFVRQKGGRWLPYHHHVELGVLSSSDLQVEGRNITVPVAEKVYSTYYDGQAAQGYGFDGIKFYVVNALGMHINRDMDFLVGMYIGDANVAGLIDTLPTDQANFLIHGPRTQ